MKHDTSFMLIAPSSGIVIAIKNVHQTLLIVSAHEGVCSLLVIGGGMCAMFVFLVLIAAGLQCSDQEECLAGHEARSSSR